MELVKNCPISWAGSELRVDIEVYGRGGTLSPKTYIVRFKNRRLTPFQQRIYGITFTVSALLKITHDKYIKAMAYRPNPFLHLVPKQERSWGRHLVFPMTFPTPPRRRLVR